MTNLTIKKSGPSDALWIVPTRSRPQNIAPMIEAWSNSRVYAHLKFVIDQDDPKYDQYIEELKGTPDWVSFMDITTHLMLVPKLNRMANLYCQEYEFIGFMGDDHRPKTPIWDGLMSAELRRRGFGMAYANDLFQKENLPTSVLMTANIIRALGYMAPPTLEHLYCDNFWKAMGQATEALVYMDHIVIEHQHPHVGRYPSDEQYDWVNSNRQYDKDGHAWETYQRKGFGFDHAKLMAVKQLVRGA